MTGTGQKRLRLKHDDPTARQLVDAVKAGDVDTIRSLVAVDPRVVTARIEDGKGGSRSLLHVVSEPPGHFPRGGAVVELLVGLGADPNALCEGWHTELPLHWAASADDVEVVDALLDAGANIGERGGAVGGGTALDNAIGYGCWQVARRLVERGAPIRKLWHAAALGMSARLEELLSIASPESIDEALWHACRGGQRRTAALLLAHGGDPGWVPPYDTRRAAEVASLVDSRREGLSEWLAQRDS